jgi:hypothetical protein
MVLKKQRIITFQYNVAIINFKEIHQIFGKKAICHKVKLR